MARHRSAPNDRLVDTSEFRTELKNLDDAALVAEYLEGRRLAFHELANRYHQRLLNFIYRTIGDRDRAEDLVQETFIRVYRHLHRFDPTKKFSTWIMAVGTACQTTTGPHTGDTSKMSAATAS